MEQLTTWPHDHRWLTMAACFVWIMVSCGLSGHLWMHGRFVPWRKRFVWTIILFVPIFGWLAYGGFYSIPKSGPTKQDTVETGGVAGSVGDGHGGGF